MNKRYVRELPDGYEEVYTIDAKSKKIGIILNVSSFFVMAIPFIIGYFILDKTKIHEEVNRFLMLLMAISLIVMIVIHELIHGLFYKILTKQKLTFGMSWSCAFCGVPDIYCYRKTMIIVSMAPCIVLSLLMLIPLILVSNFYIALGVLFVFSGHFGGCIGDLYTTYLLTFKYKDNDILLNDTGPKQTFYMRKK